MCAHVHGAPAAKVVVRSWRRDVRSIRMCAAMIQEKGGGRQGKEAGGREDG